MIRNSFHRPFFLIAAFVFLGSFACETRAAPISSPACGAVTSSFGPRVPPKKGASSSHPGTDFGCNGSPLIANVAGSLDCKPKSDGNGAGNRCHIQAPCFKFSYFHMNDSGFKPGGYKPPGATKAVPIPYGTSIGLSGNTGNSTGPHLHFEFRVGNTPIDPVYAFSKYSTVEEVCTPDAVTDLLNNRNKSLGKPVNADDDPNPNHMEEESVCDMNPLTTP